MVSMTQGKLTWRRLAAGVSAAAAVLLGLAGPASNMPVAQAADGVISSAYLSVTADGEFAAGDNSWNGTAAPGKDTGTTKDDALQNNVVRSNDYITYAIDANIATAGDVTFVFTAPTGLVWDASVTQSCKPGGGTFSSDGQTFTCVRTMDSGQGTFYLKARVVGLGNGAMVPTVTMKAGNLAQTTATVPYGSGKVTVSAVGKADVALEWSSIFASSIRSNVGGLLSSFSIFLFDPVDPVSGMKGVEPLASEFTFQLKLPAGLTGAVITGCVPGAGFTTGIADNQLTDPGTWTCVLDATDPSTINFTVENADSTLSRYPIKRDNVPMDNSWGIFSAVNLKIWFPLNDNGHTNFPTGITSGPYGFQVITFDPPTKGDGTAQGQGSNYGTGYAPNQQPGASCVSSSSYSILASNSGVTSNNPTNCVSSTVSLAVERPSISVRIGTLSGDTLPDEGSTFYTNNGLVLPGGKYLVGATVNGPTKLVNPTLSNASGCFTYDNTLQQLDSSPIMYNTSQASLKYLYAISSSIATVEYASIPFINDSQRKSFDCGVAGGSSDTFGGSPVIWSLTPTDVAAVTAIRWTWVDPIQAGGMVPSMVLPMTRPTTPLPSGAATATDAASTGKVIIPIFFTTQYTATEYASIFAWRASAYNPVANSSDSSGQNASASGGRVLANDAEVQVALSWADVVNAAGMNKPGTTHEITVTPSLMPDDGSGLAKDVTIQVQLPNACVTYQPGSASQTGNSQFDLGSSPAVPDCDGANPGPGQLLTFSLGDLTADNANKPVTFSVTIDPSYKYNLPGDLVATATSYTDSDLRTATSCNIPASGNTCTAIRTGQGSLPIAYSTDFTVTKTASAAKVLPGSQFTYSISWANHLPDNKSAGTGLFVDVLPFNEDGRGTTGLGGLRVDDITVRSSSTHNNPGDITFQYTCEDAMTVMAKVAADPSGNSVTTWQSTNCQTATTFVSAVRFVTVELENGSVDIIDMKVTPASLSATGVIVNTVYGKTSLITEPLRDVALNELVSGVGSLAGNVFNDLNYNWTNDLAAGDDSPAAGSTVSIVGGFTYGPDMAPGGGDDVMLDSAAVVQQSITDGLLPAPVAVNPDGTYSFPAINPGRYQVQVTVPAGYQVAVLPDASSNNPKTGPTSDGSGLTQPANDIIVGSGIDVTDINFGIQKTLEIGLTDKSVSGKANNDIPGNVFVAADDLVSNNELTGDVFTGADAVWRPPAATITSETTSDLGAAVSFDPTTGGYVYTPPTDTLGDPADFFTYTVTDVQGHTATATVNITLTADAPHLTTTRSAGQSAEQTVLLSYLQGDEENGTAPGTVTFVNTVTVDEAAKATYSCQIVSIAPDTAQASISEATVTFTATADTVVGTYTVTAQCADSLGRQTDAVTNIVHVVAPELTIEPAPGGVLADGATGAVGDTIIWTYKVTNTGTADLTNITLTDLFTRPPVTAPGISVLDESLNGEPAITCGDIANGAISLAPGESIECTGTSTVTQADIDAGQAVNAESVTGEAVTDLATATTQAGPAPAQVPLDQNAVMTVEKIAKVTDVNYNDQVDLGDQIVFEITVTNTGNVTLRNATVADLMEGLTLDCGDQVNGQIILTPDAPGNVIVCTTSVYTITADDVAAGEVVNVATADGQYGSEAGGDGGTRGVPGGDISSEPSEVTVPVTAPQAQAPTGGWVASSGSWQWAWLFGAGLLLTGGWFLVRRRSQRQAGDAV